MFCIKCGQQLDDSALFCSRCGNAVGGVAPAAEVQQTYTLTIDRASEAYLINPPIKATIGDSIFLSIDNGATVTTQLEPGRHTIFFKSSIRSRQVEVNIPEHKIIRIHWNRFTGQLCADVK